jgi:hypothetical protein
MSNNQRTRSVSDEETIARKQSFAKSSFQREEIDNLKARERKILPQVPSSSKIYAVEKQSCADEL